MLVSSFEFRVSGFEFRVSSFGFRFFGLGLLDYGSARVSLARNPRQINHPRLTNKKQGKMVMNMQQTGKLVKKELSLWTSGDACPTSHIRRARL